MRQSKRSIVTFVNFACAVSLACLSAAISPPGASAAASKTDLLITTPTGWSGRVFALPTRGGGASVITNKGGAIKISLASNKIGGLSLQLFSKQGKYLGPILLYASGNTGALRLNASNAKSINLGEINLMPGYAKLKKFLPVGLVRTGVSLSGGKPIGVGRLGLLPPVKIKSAKIAATDAKCSPGSDESGAGGDCDQDGVPNAVDVDDDGDRTLDMSDPQSSKSSASVVPYSGIRQQYPGAQNIHTGATRTSIDQSLGDRMNGLRFAFYLGQPYLTQGSNSSASLDTVWAECPEGMSWCSGAGSTVTTHGFSEIGWGLDQANGGQGTRWADFRGQTCQQNGGGSYICTAKPNSYPGFAFNLLKNQWGSTWASFFAPNTTNTLGTVVPGDTMMLKWRESSSSEPSQMPVSIKPYFITTPGLHSATGDKDYTVTNTTLSSTPGSSSNPIKAASDGTVTLRFWRPQRFALTGESGQYYDLGALNWGTITDGALPPAGGYVQPNRHGGCALSSLSGLRATPLTQDIMTDLYRASDQTPVDSPSDPDNLLGFKVNVKSCAQSVGLPTTSGTRIMLNLSAAGQPVTGGMDTSNLILQIQMP